MRGIVAAQSSYSETTSSLRGFVWESLFKHWPSADLDCAHPPCDPFAVAIPCTSVAPESSLSLAAGALSVGHKPSDPVASCSLSRVLKPSDSVASGSLWVGSVASSSSASLPLLVAPRGATLPPSHNSQRPARPSQTHLAATSTHWAENRG